jgi:hypothetical protein
MKESLNNYKHLKNSVKHWLFELFGKTASPIPTPCHAATSHAMKLESE